MKKYLLLIITCLLILIPVTAKAVDSDDFSKKVKGTTKKAAIQSCETGESDTYHCYRYTFLPGIHPMHNTTVWTNKTLGCGFELTDWSYDDCKSSSLDVTYEQCKTKTKEDKDGNVASTKEYCKNITHSGFNGTADFYDFRTDKGSSIQCSNLKPLHIIYKLGTIIAPIMTILFVTFDLVSSVMSGDPKKISKFRSKVIRRLIALAILIVLPILISFLVETLSKNSSIKDPTLLRCVVIGN